MRMRAIKPGYFQNEELGQLVVEARYLFAGLWLAADREGRLEDRPMRLKALIMPYDPYDARQIDSWLNELQRVGMISRYTVDGQRYMAVLKFSAHQRPHSNESASVIPPPPNGLNSETVHHGAQGLPPSSTALGTKADSAAHHGSEDFGLKGSTGVPELEEEPGLTQAHARTHEAESNDFLKSLDDDDDPGTPVEDAPVPFADEPPELVVKLQPLDERARRKEMPASGDELARAKRFWKAKFAETGAETAFHTSWTRAMTWPEQDDANGRRRQPLSDRALHEWLARDFERARESALPTPLSTLRNGRSRVPESELRQFEGIEVTA